MRNRIYVVLLYSITTSITDYNLKKDFYLGKGPRAKTSSPPYIENQILSFKLMENRPRKTSPTNVAQNMVSMPKKWYFDVYSTLGEMGER